MTLIIIIVIIAAAVFIYRTNAKKRNEENVEAMRKRWAQEAFERQHRMVENPQYPLDGGCVDCTFRNYNEVEKAGYDTKSVVYCEKCRQFVNIIPYCDDFIHECNTQGMRDFVNAFSGK